MTEWRDTSGSTLTDYPRPSVAVDVAVLTCRDDVLQVVVVEHRLGESALPGTFLHEGERLADAAVRALRDKAGLTGTRFHQLALFDDPDRDNRGWVISMAHTAVIPFGDLPEGADLVEVHDGEAAQDLAFDHADMVRLAVDDLRTRYAERVDPDRLLGESFTVLQLRRLYEAVFGLTLQKDSFRRHVRDALEATERRESDGAGRPAEVFRRRGEARLSAKAAVLFAG
ncbi:NUDIX hydrolase [Rhodococcus spelaei]|uniref:NUDIX hydrolase n=1 Tax=Rhodococcus spelaei TaxID=2546320 RepID=A0A541B4F0_9NOCA|nr:NUDIX domain-containing protein [Rhodococcus spelaei]TQF67190.1 NUDIX hydrolase [Rhodococcus spelaei]